MNPQAVGIFDRDDVAAQRTTYRQLMDKLYAQNKYRENLREVKSYNPEMMKSQNPIIHG
jgi:hypothetical protein